MTAAAPMQWESWRWLSLSEVLARLGLEWEYAPSRLVSVVRRAGEPEMLFAGSALDIWRWLEETGRIEPRPTRKEVIA